jgi:hypothetical protein
LTRKILQTAISFLEGRKEEEEEEEEEESGNQVIEDCKQVMDGFHVYLRLLVEKMPKNMAFDDLKEFIKNCDWPDGS